MRRALGTGALLAAALLPARSGSAAFVDEAAARGIESAADVLGVAWSDVNGDTLPDLYFSVLLPDGIVSGENRLYVQQPDGTFVDTSDTELRNGGNGYGICFADVDEDLDADLYLSNGFLDESLFGVFPKENKLFLNDGSGSFTRAGAGSGVEDVPSGRSAVFADYDRDGLLDLFVAEPFGERDELFHNIGNATFVEVGLEAGLVDDSSNGNGAAWGDFDNDGWPDLFVANHGEPNLCALLGVACERDFLYRNLGPDAGGVVHFEEVAGQVGLDRREPSFGGAWGDYDNDGDLDLYVTSGFDVQLPGGSSAPNLLYHNLLAETGQATFEERAGAAGLADPGTSFSANWADYDNDGWLDLFWTNSFDNGGSPRNRLLRNLGPGPDGRPVFEDRTGAELGQTGRGQGAAWADFDGDGFQDLAVMNVLDAPVRLYRNLGNANHWLHVDTVGTDSNADGVGARLTLATAGGLVLHREIYAGGGYLSEDSLEAEFGLGAENRIVSLAVRWPSGCVQTLEPADFGGVIPLDRRIVVVEDCSSPVEPEPWIYRGFRRDLLDLAGPPPNPADPDLRLPSYVPRPSAPPWSDPEAVLDDPRLFYYLADTDGGTLSVGRDLSASSVRLTW